MVHLACETDFVARNDVFQKTARGTAGTAAFLDIPGLEERPPEEIQDWPVDALRSAPLILLPQGENPIPTSDPITVDQTIQSTIASTGESLRLLRAVSYAAPFPSDPQIRYIPGVYSHEGRYGAMVVVSMGSADPAKQIGNMVHGPGGDELEKDAARLTRDVARQACAFPTKMIRATPGAAGGARRGTGGSAFHRGW